MNRLPRAVRERRWQIVGLVVAAAVVCAGKQFYRHASASELAPLLAPTAWLVSVATGVRFAYEAGAGWVSRTASFVIAPGCAGMNFALAAFFAVAIGWRDRMRDAATTAGRLALAAALAYGATLVVNSVRLAVAVALHRRGVHVDGLNAAAIHRIEGIAVYLGGLCAVYFLACGRGRRGGADAAAG